jgi:IS5 family transposase
MLKYKERKGYDVHSIGARQAKLKDLGDPLSRLKDGVDFELFRDLLEKQLEKKFRGKGGRRPYDYVLMFKILVLQRYYNLSDDQVEYQINDRLSFMFFLDLSIGDDIPDSKTVWNFREKLIDLELVQALFELFLGELEKLKLVAHEGKIVDASFVDVPKQRNTKAENEEIKGGNIPISISENPNKEAQKDTDARWTKKGDVSYFGYKNHVKVDSKSKIITKYDVTDASVHDSQSLENLLDTTDSGQDLYADSAYTGEKQESLISDKKMNNQVCEKGYRNKELTQEQKDNNTQKSRTRSRVEHIFGFMEMSMNGMYLCCIGKKRIEACIGLMNLTYNMFRKIQLCGF